MTDEEARERATDILSASIEDTGRLLSGGELTATPFDLAETMVDALTGEESREVLASMAAIASILLSAVSTHTGRSAGDLLVAMRKAMA